MCKSLMPSQKQCMERILEQENIYYRRANIIVVGEPQIGKSYLLKYMSNLDRRYLYVNFTREYLEKFLKGKRLGSVDFHKFQVFLRKTFSEYNDRIIILDEIDSVVSILIQGKDENLIVLFRQFLAMDQPVKYIFVTSRFSREIIDRLTKEYGNRIITLGFHKDDKKYIIRTCFDNINLFELDKINNLRQMLKERK